MNDEIAQLRKQMAEMVKRVCDLEDEVIKLGGSAKPICKDGVVQLILDHLKNGYHSLTHETDLILMRDLVRVMEPVYPDEEFFRMYNRDATKIAKRLGALLTQHNSLVKLKGSYYVPVDPHIENSKHSNVSCNVWVLRNVKKYKKMGPAELYRDYEQQWSNACTVYADKVKDQSLEQEPSFM